MKRKLLWIFLVAAPLVSASSLGGFIGGCNAGGCGGSYNGNTFSFAGPFPNVPYTGYLDIGIGTNGGAFSSGGNTCDYDAILHGVNCDGEIRLGASLGPPDDTGLSIGDVVSVTGTGFAEGFFCWDCSVGLPPPLFDLNVTATYQFTLTDPTAPFPFTWTAAQFASAPEPETFAFATLGLAAAAMVLPRRRAQHRR